MQELQQLEMQRSQMMRQLEGLQGEMQQSIPTSMENIKTLENELLTEVEKIEKEICRNNK
jgi:prefoldin subunit 5